MTDSNKNGINLAKVLRRTGFHLPVDEDEVEHFERNIDCENEKPIHWENPLEILHKGKVSSVNLTLQGGDTNTANNLSMAARDGNSISNNVRKKMNEDRKNQKK